MKTMDWLMSHALICVSAQLATDAPLQACMHGWLEPVRVSYYKRQSL